MNLNTEQYFSVVPEIHAPRSVFDRSFTYKTTINSDYLYPIFIDEALPGDSFNLTFQVFGRLLDPLVVPIMDELYFETLWFKIPNRLVWNHWVNFCGEQDNPDDSVDFLIPTVNSGDDGFAVGTLADYFGIPVNVPNLSVNSLPFRCYNLVYNQWFRDENLINSVTVEKGDSDDIDNYTLLKSAKMHDYFTSCLPFAQKGDPVMLPLGEFAPVVNGADNPVSLFPGNESLHWYNMATKQPAASTANQTRDIVIRSGNAAGFGATQATASASTGISDYNYNIFPANLRADLRNATGASISDFVFAMKLEQKRSRDAIGGTRYIEWIKSHFSVDSPDARLQRAEFLGSTREMIDINTVIQTSATSDVSPQGNLTAYGVINNHQAGFNTSFTEHSYVLGLCRIRHNPVYQQGLNKMWSRSTLLDFYLPVFNGISEQPVLNSEIYAQGASVLNAKGNPVDDDAFGFQEAWAEYRYKPSMITGLLRSGVTGSIDVYHLAQNFPSLPLLNQSFIEENIDLDRALAIPEDEPNTYQFILDFRFVYQCARPMPVRNIPNDLSMHF